MAFHHGCPSSSLKNLQSFHLEIPEIPVTQHIQVSRFTIGIGEKYWKIILFSWSTPVLCPRYVHCSGSCGSKLQTLMEQPSMFQRTFFLRPITSKKLLRHTSRYRTKDLSHKDLSLTHLLQDLPVEIRLGLQLAHLNLLGTTNPHKSTQLQA